MENVTTIQISTSLKNKLEGLKDFTRETYENVISKLIDIVAEDNMELTAKTKRDIEESRKQIKAGKFATLEQVKKELDLA
ncbi:MAG: hypothetical protein PHC66_01495 [Candidatus Nanoarchaeia archaeon]|nr:hypothetical protein [Candidatus Nanoarchaeia archaeon]MDD5239167.1 hypothetical protein [Candidatus Nanoarchaeia archaeon]